MACVATWSFGLQAVLRASTSIEEGKNCVDVLERAINGRLPASLLDGNVYALVIYHFLQLLKMIQQQGHTMLVEDAIPIVMV